MRVTFTVSSNSFEDGDYLSNDFILSADFGFGCAGGNKSPHLKWSGAPDGTKSFPITCYDPDAPTGSGFWHWLVVNIPASVNELAFNLHFNTLARAQIMGLFKR
jgi:Raf kinase inhibitor-like YbhB/YbcL family protein